MVNNIEDKDIKIIRGVIFVLVDILIIDFFDFRVINISLIHIVVGIICIAFLIYVIYKVVSNMIIDKKIVFAYLLIYIDILMFVILIWSLPYWLSCSQPCYF